MGSGLARAGTVTGSMLDSFLPTRIPPSAALGTAGTRSVLVDRAAAAGIDLAICYVLLELPVIYLISELFPGRFEALGTAGLALSLAFLVPVYITYSFFFEWRFSRTPGKVNRRLVVATADGAPCTLRASAIRNLLRYVDLLGVPPLVVGLVSAVVSPSGRRIGDVAAGTLVVRARSPAGRGLDRIDGPEEVTRSDE